VRTLADRSGEGSAAAASRRWSGETIGGAARHDPKGLPVPRKLAAVLLVLLALPSSAAAATNDIGRIAYTTDRDGNNEIYAARVDGDGETNLTNNPATDQSPAWSADGSKIAFVSDRNGRMDLWVMNWDGSDQHKVTDGNPSSSDADPAWSPDGTSIAFASSRPWGDAWHVWVLDVATGSVRQLTGGWGVSPSWSPDGTRLTFDGGGVIHVIDADGRSDVQITPPGLPPAGSPVWTPWGGDIVFGRYDDDWQTTNVRQLYIQSLYGGDAVPVTSGPYYHDHASFSPDWSFMVFQRQEGVFGSPELHYMRLSESVAYPSVTGPGRNFVPSWGLTYAAPPPPTPPVPDTTPPTITIRVPTASGTDRIGVYTVGQVVPADYECADTDSGVRHCMGPVENGSPIDTRFPGTHEFRVFAADQAGNPVYRSAWYRVVYPFHGFAAPVVNGELNELRAGFGVPLKFSLGGAYGLEVVTTVEQQRIDCASRMPLEIAAPATGTLTYNASLDRYLYDWTTQKTWAGTCRSVTLSLRDGTRHAADFRLVK
jgi:Tol biopolymer transport system component